MTGLLLRADATPSIGVGHLSRCVAVATAARARGWDVALCGTFTAGQWLLGDLPVVPALRPADVVLVDHYGLGEVSLPSLVVSMEDGQFGRRRADIVVDANLSATPRPDDGSPVVLRGPAYAPLRAEIRATRWRGGAVPPKVVVVMGGGAAPSAVAASVEALRATGVPASVVAVSSSPVPGVAVIPPTPELPALFASADLVVSAAGVTLLELCCIGTPAALVQIADNQAAGYTAAVNQGLAAGLGKDPREHVEVLRTLLQSAPARKALGEKAMTAVDGKGTERILDAVEAALRHETPIGAHESPIGAPGGPLFSTLPEGTDNPGRRGETGAEDQAQLPAVGGSIGGSSSESPIGAPEGAPFSALAEGTDNSGQRKETRTEDQAQPPAVGSSIGRSSSESPIGAFGGPPISTLPEGTDNSGSLVGESSVAPHVRPATHADSALLLAWRNDPRTRAWSRTADPVAQPDHEAWLSRVLADPDRRLLVAEYDHHPVGTVRFDRDGDHWEISITVAPEARGRKLAVPILLAAERVLPRATTIRACVHQDNAASRALFQRAGYDEEGGEPWLWFAKTV